ncbi:MAG: AAA family ATPase [Marmoricola sp.]
MKAALNPYNPGSGLRPPALAGRDSELEALDVTLERTSAGLSNRGIILTGLRGVGKTVLLNEMRDRAETADWFVVGVEARADAAGTASVQRALARDMAAQARRLSRARHVTDRIKQALQSVSAFSLSLGAKGIDLGVTIEPGRADSGDIEVDLPELVQDLCLALAEQGSAFGLFIDEMQDLDADLLRALLVTQHQAGQRGWSFYIMGAGLPHLPGVLSETRSYAERLFDYRTISRLHENDAISALVQPALPHGVSYTDDALQVLLEASGGYPYFLQEYGRGTWEVAGSPQFTAADARDGVALGLQRLDAGFFASRWKRATPAERRLLIAMADDQDNPSTSSEVARRMGIKPTSLGPYRANLISKGLVYAPEHGMLAYTVPGMSAFVFRHRDDF